MPRIFSWLFRWSLELTGSSILLFNYQPYDRQQHIIGMYNATVNSIRTIWYLYRVYGEFKDFMGSTPGSEGYHEKMKIFMVRTAERVRQLCEVNQGVYARIGQIISTMTGIFPQPFLT